MKSVFLIFFLFANSLYAQILIAPKAEMDLRTWLGDRVPFEQAFQCGESQQFTSKKSNCVYECSDTMGCKESCDWGSLTSFEIKVEVCEKDSYTLISDHGLVIEVSRTDYEKFYLTWAASFLKELYFFISPIIEIEIDSVRPFFRKKIENGKLVQIPTAEINVRVKSQEVVWQNYFNLVFATNKKGLSQLIEFSSGDERAFFLRQKKVIGGRIAW